MKHFLFLLTILIMSLNVNAEKKPKVVKITATPENAAIYINNVFSGNGYAEFTHPKRNEVTVIRIEAPEYITLSSKYYGDDKRPTVSFSLQQDGFYRASAASGIVNKYFTVLIDPQYYKIEDGKVVVDEAWKMLHQIILNYFDEIETTDYHGGYLQTPWKYKVFTVADRQIRNRVTVRDISTVDKVAFQIKIDSEVAGSRAARHGEFETIDRIPKELETIIQELQTRIGKVSNL